jgi:hypothetical protein
MFSSMKERFGSKQTVEPLTPEEQKAELKRQRKIAMAKAQKRKDKMDRRQQRRIDHAK